MTQKEIEKAADEFAEREYETNGVTREQARPEASGQAVETVKVEWEE